MRQAHGYTVGDMHTGCGDSFEPHDTDTQVPQWGDVKSKLVKHNGWHQTVPLEPPGSSDSFYVLSMQKQQDSDGRHV